MCFIDFNQTLSQEFEIKMYIKNFFYLRLQGALNFFI
jgi:hypothetical protein